MQNEESTSPTARAARTLDRLLIPLSHAVIPATVVLFTVLLLLGIDSLETPTGEALPLQVLADPDDAFTPPQAQTRLREEAPRDAFHTHREETPFWVSIQLPAQLPEQPAVVLPSRHARHLSCWDATLQNPLGSADRNRTTGAFQNFRAGFAVAVEAVPSGQVLCRGEFSGPAVISAQLWPATELSAADRRDRYSAGLLEGAMLSLVAFAVVMSVLGRNGSWLLLAVWLFANLRLAMISVGWDVQWLGMRIPVEWLSPLRQITIAAYYVVTFALFARLFEESQAKLQEGLPLQLAKLAGLVLLLAAVTLPFATFLPLMWVIVSFGILIMTGYLLRMLREPERRVAMAYGLALVVVLTGSLTEILAAAFEFELLRTFHNNLTAGLASSALVILAFAAQMRSERQRRAAAQRALVRTYESTPVGLFTLADDGTFLRGNPALERVLGVTLKNDMPQRWQDIVGETAWQALRESIRHGGDHDVELPAPGQDGGQPRWLLLRARLTDQGVEGSLQDITDRVAMTRRLSYLADHDPVTETKNRRGLETDLDAALGAATDGEHTALLHINLDRFRLLNELYGYQSGDALLREVCRRVQAELPPQASLGRLSADLMLVVFRDTPLVAANRIAWRLLDSIASRPFQINGHSFRVQASAGLVELTPGMSGKEAMAAAERACRDAKQGPRLVAYDRDDRALLERGEELRLIRSLESNEPPAGLHLEMQPLLSVEQPHASLNFEVLLRMRDAQGRPVPAIRALRAAESSGNMSKLDTWVLTRTLQWLERHRPELPNTRFVCVNLSGASLNDEAFVDSVLQIMERYPKAAPLLCLEVTEAVALHDLSGTRRVMDRLKAHGVRVALDDFGAGFTSFSYLRELEAEVLKIDGSLVRDMTQHPRNTAIVSAIVNLAQNMGMRTIAEWAEDAATVSALMECGVDYIQGWAIAPSQLPDQVLAARSAADFIQDAEVLHLLPPADRGDPER